MAQRARPRPIPFAEVVETGAGRGDVLHRLLVDRLETYARRVPAKARREVLGKELDPREGLAAKVDVGVEERPCELRKVAVRGAELAQRRQRALEAQLAHNQLFDLEWKRLCGRSAGAARGAGTRTDSHRSMRAARHAIVRNGPRQARLPDCSLLPPCRCFGRCDSRRRR